MWILILFARLVPISQKNFFTIWPVLPCLSFTSSLFHLCPPRFPHLLWTVPSSGLWCGLWAVPLTSRTYFVLVCSGCADVFLIPPQERRISRAVVSRFLWRWTSRFQENPAHPLPFQTAVCLLRKNFGKCQMRIIFYQIDVNRGSPLS